MSGGMRGARRDGTGDRTNDRTSDGTGDRTNDGTNDRSCDESRADAPRFGGRAALVAVAAAFVVVAPVAVIAWSGDRGSASFGDSETVGRNRIGAATVDLEVGSRTTPLRADGLAPGDLVTGEIELVNAGTVALRYAVTVTSIGDGSLGPWLTWQFLPSTPDEPCPAETSWRSGPAGAVRVDVGQGDRGEVMVMGDVAAGADAGDRILDVGASERLCVAVTVDLDAPNSVQNSTAEVRITAHGEQLGPDETIADTTDGPAEVAP